MKVKVVNTTVTFLLPVPTGNQTKNTQSYYVIFSLIFLSVCALDRAVRAGLHEASREARQVNK